MAARVTVPTVNPLDFHGFSHGGSSSPCRFQDTFHPQRICGSRALIARLDRRCGFGHLAIFWIILGCSMLFRRFFWENWRNHGFSSQDDTTIQLKGHQAKVCKECNFQDVCVPPHGFSKLARHLCLHIFLMYLLK